MIFKKGDVVVIDENTKYGFYKMKLNHLVGKPPYTIYSISENDRIKFSKFGDSYPNDMFVSCTQPIQLDDDLFQI